MPRALRAQAARTPDAVAAEVRATQTLTLRGSWTRAPTSSRTTCARWACGPGDRVGLCLERSLELVVGLLAILKAGGAYVPVDREATRRSASRCMLQDAGVERARSRRQALADELPAVAGLLVLLDADADAHRARSRTTRAGRGGGRRRPWPT